MRLVSVTIILGFLLGGPLFGHGDVQERIQMLDQRISSNPGDATLYLQRGQLHRELGRLTDALRDCSKALKIEPGLNDAILCKGTALLELHQADTALIAFNQYLAVHPNHLPARLRRANALVELQRYDSAVADFDFILKDNPSPEVYLQAAQTLLLAEPERPDRALQTIEEGLQRIGPVITLQEFAFRLQKEHKRYDLAVATIDDILATATWKERWLLEKGDILLLADRAQEACATFEQARQALLTKTPRRESTVELTRELDYKLKECSLRNHHEK